MSRLMIYGATGYTGRMAAEHAVASGLAPILAGRDEAKLAGLGQRLGAEYRAFGLNDGGIIDLALSDVAVLLNCAGPFSRTAEVLMWAAIRSHVHYLDVAAELDSYRLAETCDAEARDTGVMLLPGSGGSVAMLGSLAARAAERVAQPRSISIALHVAGSMSRGSAISASEGLTNQCLARVDGVVTEADPTGLRDFDFGRGPVSCFPVTLPDLVTIWRTQRVPDIATFVHVSGNAFPDGAIDEQPVGPSAEERDANRYQAALEVTGADGRVVRATLDTVNGYSFTPLAAVEACRRVLGGEVQPGFQTPAGLFGSGFAETIADTTIIILEGSPHVSHP
jgi:short subunit dehydrogenase-like uncharacterized protein